MSTVLKLDDFAQLVTVVLHVSRAFSLDSGLAGDT
jgi:hypothetical protein